MKKLILSIVIIAASILCCACGYDYSNWSEVEIYNNGTIKIPDNWKQGVHNHLIYFYDDNDKIYLFESKCFPPLEEDINNGTLSIDETIEANVFTEKFQALYLLNSNVLSNGAYYGKASTSVDGDIQTMNYLSFYSDDQECIFYVNNNVDEKILYQIAESYDSQ